VEPPIGIEPMTYALREGLELSSTVHWVTLACSLRSSFRSRPRSSRAVVSRCVNTSSRPPGRAEPECFLIRKAHALLTCSGWALNWLCRPSTSTVVRWRLPRSSLNQSLGGRAKHYKRVPWPTWQITVQISLGRAMCWPRWLLAVDGCPGASRGHARPGPTRIVPGSIISRACPCRAVRSGANS
jgi:hypothetical protein